MGRMKSLVAGALTACAAIGPSGAVAQAQTAHFAPVPGSPFAAYGPASAVAFGSSGRLAVITDYMTGELSTYRVGLTTPSLTPTGMTGDPTGNPFDVAFDAAGSVMVTGEQNSLTTWTVAPGTGALTPVASRSVPGTAPGVAVALNPAGTLLAAADSGQPGVVLYRVDPTSGALRPIPGSPFAAGAGPTSVAFSPSGGLLAVTNSDGEIHMFTVSTTAARPLRPVAGSPFTTGGVDNGAQSATFSPSGTMLAVALAYGPGTSVFDVDPTSGALTPAPGGAALPEANSVSFNRVGRLLASDAGQHRPVRRR